MSKSSDAKKQVRLDADNYNRLVDIQANCDWPVTLQVLANYGLRNGMSAVEKAFSKPDVRFTIPTVPLTVEDHLTPILRKKHKHQ